MQTEDMIYLCPVYSGAPQCIRANKESAPGRALYEKLRQDVAWFSAHFSDNAVLQSGWGHAYFCPEDGSFLTFDRNSPTAHRCPVCGRVSHDPLHNAAWLYLYRYEAVMSAYEAAVLSCMEPCQEYLAHFTRIIGFYSRNYHAFKPHACGPAASGQGKIAPQALNEAIFITRITQGLELVHKRLPDAFVQEVCRDLLIPAARFLQEQRNWINNIPCWINAALTAAGCFTGEKDLVELAFAAPFGMYDQIEHGVTESRFWFEGSVHYNCFTLEAFLNQLSFAAQHGIPVRGETARKVSEMVAAVHNLAFSNTVLPNPNDGWPNLNLKTYSYLFEMAAALFDTEKLCKTAAGIYAGAVPRTLLPMSFPVYAGDYSAEWLMFSQERGLADDKGEREKRSICFQASDYAVLKQKNCEVFIKYGHCSPSHAHPDKMNIEITAFDIIITRDLSNCGYASRLCDGYYRTSVGHNTIVVDGRNHPGLERGMCRRYHADIPEIDVFAGEVYPGIGFWRTVHVSENGLRDVFTATAAGLHIFDWVFHVEGELKEPAALQPDHFGFAENGYQYLRKVRSMAVDGPFTLQWSFAGGTVWGEQTICVNHAVLYVCESCGNPANLRRTTLILRAEGRQMAVTQEWEFSRKQEQSPVINNCL